MPTDYQENSVPEPTDDEVAHDMAARPTPVASIGNVVRSVHFTNPWRVTDRWRTSEGWEYRLTDLGDSAVSLILAGKITATIQVVD